METQGRGSGRAATGDAPTHVPRARTTQAGPRRMELNEVLRLVDSSPDGLLVLSGEGRIRYANQTAHEIMGQSGGLIGTEFGFPMGDELNYAIEVRRPGGDVRAAQMRVTPVTSDGERGWVVALRDTTEAGSATPAGGRDEAPAPDREAGHDDALAVTSHELRNPMLALTGYLELLLLDWESLEDEARLAYLHKAQRVARRLQLVVSRFLNAAQLESGIFAPSVQSVRLLDVVLEGVQELGDQAAEVDLRIPPDCLVNVHADHVWSMVSNFVINAFRHGAAPVVVAADRSGPWVDVAVRDRGPGVPVDAAERLFARYVRGAGDDSVPGTGLGLWIVRSIARAYGGDAWYEPCEAGGSQFVCRLPAAPGE
jgi:signal transduction histidine kinase